MILPYVYRLTHKETGQFYIGFRANKKQKSISSEDILQYKSSSTYVKELGFENFNVEIIAEFFKADDAYEFEQALINEHFKDPLCMNKSCFHDKKQFSVSGKPVSLHTRELMSKKKIGRTLSSESRELLSIKKSGENHYLYGKKQSPETRKKISDKLKDENHPRAKSVLVNGVIYSTIKAASIALSYHNGLLSWIILGKRKLNKNIWQAELVSN